MTSPVFLFDVDGVLVDTEHLHEKATCEAAGRYVDCSGGGSTLDKLLRAGVSVQDVRAIYDVKKQLFALYSEQISPDPELVDYFRMLGRRAILGACSNSNKETCEKVLRRARLYEFFDVIVYGSEVKRLKPAPDIYREAMGRLTVSPDRCIVFEDSIEGETAAYESGINLVIRCTTTSLLKELKKCVSSYLPQG